MKVSKAITSCVLSGLLVLTAVPCAYAAPAPENGAAATKEALALERMTMQESADALRVVELGDMPASTTGVSRDARADVPLEPVALSDEFKYFAKYESSQNYDQGLSWGDGYHALGYYQMDNRSILQDFLTTCYRYDPVTFAMFEPYTDDAEAALDLSDASTWEEEKWGVDEVWHEAYAAAPDVFAALQDSYMYETSYLPAQTYLEGRGISIADRADCIKGLCWGVANLFGLTGWHRFVGGPVATYGDNGELVWTEYPGCGLSNDMSDAEFAVTLAGYVAENVAVFYPNQPQYHEGWSNRYLREINDCLGFIPDLIEGSWYDEWVASVQDAGLMSGYAGGYMAGRFGPEDRITRGQIVTILYRASNPDSVATTDPAAYAPESSFEDVAGSYYYTAAIEWAREQGVVTGYVDPATGEPTGMFGPENPVTREELATILARYAMQAQDGGLDVSDAALQAFPDADQVTAFASEPLAWCVAAGVVSGDIDAQGVGWLRPQNSATRAQAAKMITVTLRQM